MAQAKQVAQFNTFVAGLITEATELTFPPNASLDEDNCVLYPQGNRRRRLGADFESGYVLSSAAVTNTELNTFAVYTASWKAVGNQGNMNFLCVQLGNMLYFYDEAVAPLSTGVKSFTVDLDDYIASSASSTSEDRISTTTARGALYVVSPSIDPIFIRYTEGTDSIAVTEVTIRVRDVEGVDDGLAVDNEPATLSTEHQYNLYNQGWFLTPSAYDPVTVYFTAAAKYPANNVQWQAAKSATDGSLNVALLRRTVLGTTQAPRGHYILDAFSKDRNTASGLTGIPTVSTLTRPAAVASYAGRVAYGALGSVYISEVLDDRLANSGKCYQDADPTSEDISDLIDTDGMVIPIPEAGTILALVPIGAGLIVLANNGVWTISGTDGGFKATDFSVRKLTSAGIISRTTWVVVEGTVYWWSENGIFRVDIDGVSGNAIPVNITDTTIKTFYNAIPQADKSSSIGYYDTATKVISWLYKDTTTADGDNTSKYYYNRVLNFNTTIGAFYTWSVSSSFGSSPYLCGAFSSTSSTTLGEFSNVIVTNLDNVITTDGSEVVAGASVSIGSTSAVNFTKFVCIVPDQALAESNNLTFCLFSNKSFTDWETYDTIVSGGGGLDYDSFLITGYDLQGDVVRQKQAPYIITHCKRTETQYVPQPDGSFELDFPSALYLQARWDWSDHGNRGKWSSTQQVYRSRSTYNPTPELTALEYNPGNILATAKSRIRGRGRSLQLKFSSESGKDFNLLGWGIIYTGNSEV